MNKTQPRPPPQPIMPSVIQTQQEKCHQRSAIKESKAEDETHSNPGNTRPVRQGGRNYNFITDQIWVDALILFLPNRICITIRLPGRTLITQHSGPCNRQYSTIILDVIHSLYKDALKRRVSSHSQVLQSERPRTPCTPFPCTWNDISSHHKDMPHLVNHHR
jgi:hypothetical protein